MDIGRDGMKWTDGERNMLRELSEAGAPIERIARLMRRSIESVYWRRHVEGVTRREDHAGPLRQTTTRVCLRCDREFQSDGPHNRVCNPCRYANANIGPLADAMIDQAAGKGG